LIQSRRRLAALKALPPVANRLLQKAKQRPRQLPSKKAKLAAAKTMLEPLAKAKERPKPKPAKKTTNFKPLGQFSAPILNTFFRIGKALIFQRLAYL
jgi:hypothetical protein